jgi:hypothetical protein
VGGGRGIHGYLRGARGSMASGEGEGGSMASGKEDPWLVGRRGIIAVWGGGLYG